MRIIEASGSNTTVSQGRSFNPGWHAVRLKTKAPLIVVMLYH
jgi:hypothetical protein